MCVCMCIYIDIYAKYICLYVYSEHILHAYSINVSRVYIVINMCVYMHLYIIACSYVFICTNTCICACIYLYVCMYESLHGYKAGT